MSKKKTTPEPPPSKAMKVILTAIRDIKAKDTKRLYLETKDRFIYNMF